MSLRSCLWCMPHAYQLIMTIVVFRSSTEKDSYMQPRCMECAINDRRRSSQGPSQTSMLGRAAAPMSGTEFGKSERELPSTLLKSAQCSSLYWFYSILTHSQKYLLGSSDFDRSSARTRYGLYSTRALIRSREISRCSKRSGNVE